MDSDDSDEEFVSADEGEDDEEESCVGAEQEEGEENEHEESCDGKEKVDDDDVADAHIHKEHKTEDKAEACEKKEKFDDDHKTDDDDTHKEQAHMEEIREDEGTSVDAPEEFEYKNEDEENESCAEAVVPEPCTEDKQCNHGVERDIPTPLDGGSGLVDEVSMVTEDVVVVQQSLDVEQFEDNVLQADGENVVTSSEETQDCSINTDSSKQQVVNDECERDKKDEVSCIDQLTIEDETAECERKGESDEDVLLETPTDAHTVDGCAGKEVPVLLPSGDITDDNIENIKPGMSCDGDNRDIADTDGDEIDVADEDESWTDWGDDPHDALYCNSDNANTDGDNIDIVKSDGSNTVPNTDGDNTNIVKPDGDNTVPNTDRDNTDVSKSDGDKSSVPNSVGDNTSAVNTDESWGWDSWADDFISQATAKVSTLMESVEGQLGIPDPALVAHKLKVEDEKAEEVRKESVNTKNVSGEDDAKSTEETENASSWFSSYMPVASTLTNLVQSKGQELVSGGIDALEFIGKSTVSYLSDGDPGLRNKRKAFLRRNKGETLSQVLHDAKVKADERQVSDSPPRGEDPKKLNDMLEKFQGIANLDALQMLSSRVETKLERILNAQSDEARDESSHLIDDIKENFEIEENEENNVDGDFKKDLFSSNKKLKMKVTCSKLLNTWSRLKKKTDAICVESSDECFENCISSLAEFVSRCMEYYRKVADMLIMTDMDAKDLAVERAKILKSVTEMFLLETADIANNFANYLANNKEDTSASDFITEIYLESENSSSLLNDSHMLLLPILQCSSIQ